MIPSLKSTTPLRDTSDLARILGLPPKAPRKSISSAFGRATNFELWMQISDQPVYRTQSEVWEVKIVEALPKCRLEFRHNGRGAWLKEAANVPEDVWRHFQGRPARDGGIETDRRWKCWERLNWMASGRRMRSRHGEIIAMMEIPSVKRDTGRLHWELVIEPLTDDGDASSDVRRIALPCCGGALLEAVAEMRASSREALLAA
jgi:hypothetical protein